MRFLKRTQTPGLREHSAFAVRLNAVTERGKIDVASASLEEPSKAQAPVQRFWTPQELAENSRG
jgi:hypothetical protein